jgi:UDP-N-acetylmuramyl pentapeptide synthase
LALKVIGEHSLQALMVAGAVGELCGLSEKQIADGIRAVEPVRGRMQPLRGVFGSTIIDDSYNASPEATKAALDMLYQLSAQHRIVILGTMNEMGDYSAKAHEEVGAYCDPAKLDLVVTVGDDAAKLLAPPARERGCKVKSFTSPYEAGAYVRQHLEKLGAEIGAQTIVLAKGSQNLVFCEETVKLLLADPADTGRLVRQSDLWMQRKRAQFGEPPRT